MPRQSRQLSPTHIYHIMVRGNSGRDIFLEDQDRYKLLSILAIKKREEAFILYAYCLMDNHFHLVLKEKKDHISHIMSRINTTYVAYFNKKNQLKGHLFQDRFKSEVVESDAYLLALIRYVHNNPLKAGLVQIPQDYQWSSYLSYIKYGDGLVQSSEVLKYFSEDLSQAREEFIDFSLEEDEDDFMDDHREEREQKEINTYDKAKYFRDQFLKRNHLTLEDLTDRRNKYLREKLIRGFKEKSVFSNREIAEFLHIGRGMVEQTSRRKRWQRTVP